MCTVNGDYFCLPSTKVDVRLKRWSWSLQRREFVDEMVSRYWLLEVSPVKWTFIVSTLTTKAALFNEKER